MATNLAAKRAAFRQLHQSGCFVQPNPWNVGSALMLQDMGFKALASTSSGMAWSLGLADNQVPLVQVLNHLAELAAAVDLPLAADFENGFADDPEGVATNVAKAIATGICGVSIEDMTAIPGQPLYDFDIAVARVKAARSAIDQSASGVVLTARCEAFLVGLPDLAETIRRLQAYAAAGADCVFAPGIREIGQLTELVRAVAPTPVNVLTPGIPVADLAGIGVRRISVGGALARVAWGAFREAAREIVEQGSFTALGRAVPFAEINGYFRARPQK